MNRILVAPSLLACDFGRLADEVIKVQEAGADWLHIDVMDGHFVPNITFGPVMVEAIRKVSRIPLDVHLMIDHPERYVQRFAEAGADYVTLHVEAAGLQDAPALRKTLESIRAAGAKPALSVRPKTGVEALKPYAEELELLLIMSVEPGFGGQAFIPEAAPKVRAVREWYHKRLSVDGGITADTGKQMREAGADVLVAGTYVFGSKDYSKAIQSLRS